MTASAVQELLTVDEAAARVGMSRKWVLRRIAIWESDRDDPRGIPAINKSGGVGRGKRWGIDPEVLEAWHEAWLTAA